MRIHTGTATRSHRPFQGQGASLYQDGEFRRLRVDCGTFTAGPETTIGDANVNKTARVDSVLDPTNEFAVDSLALASSTVEFQVRSFKDDVENESNYRPLTLTFDGDGDDATAILGTAVLIATEVYAGGIVRIRFRWKPSASGVQPDTFAAIRTAGPSSPANATTGADRAGLYYIDTPALLDTSAYTYKIQASIGATTADILTGITFTADASGPSAPIHGSVEIR